jgi:hypothetical protein
MLGHKEEETLLARVVVEIQDATHVGSHIQGFAEWELLYASSVASQATMLKNALKQVQVKDRGLRPVSISLGLQFQPGCMPSPQRMLVSVECNTFKPLNLHMLSS